MEIGNIVTFNSHPYIIENTSIIISGEHLMLTPLMVIVELLKISKNEFSEVDGTPIVQAGEFHCKCIWYSSKMNQFEESWFYSNQLKPLKDTYSTSYLNPQEPISFNYKKLVGKLVSLKTLPIELGKKKSSLTSESNKDKSLVSSLLSFISPVMQIIDLKENDSKEKKHDIKTGLQKRYVSNFTVKCRWYNPTGDKFSEKFLPVESIFLLPSITNETLDTLQKHINGVSILRIKESLFKPLSISYRSGFYLLTSFDFIKNKEVEISINDNLKFEREPDLYLKEAPDFKIISETPGAQWQTINTILELVEECVTEKNYLRIQYKSNNDTITLRTINNLVLHETLEMINGEYKTVSYVEAYCNLRKDKRYFKIDRIISAQMLNIKYT